MFLSKHRSGIYYLYYLDQDGKRFRLSTGKKQKSEALLFLKHFDQSQREKQNIIDNISLLQFLEQYLHYSATIHRANTTKTAQSSLKEFIRLLGDVQLNTITNRQAEHFLSVKKNECNIFTLNKHYVHLKSIFNTALRWQYILKNPFSGIPKPKPPESTPLYFSKDDMTKLLNVIEDMDFKELVMFGLFSGMRQAEITNLKWQDVDLERKVILIQNSTTFRTKSGKVRVLPMNDEIFKMLASKKQEIISEYVFTIDGCKYREDSISKKFKKYVRRAGLNNRLHFHSLRHTFASWLVQQGTSLYEVQKLLGHQDIKTSMIYAHLQPETLHNTVNKLSL